MKNYDVVVVGGGPIGGAVARDIARAGFSIAVFEEHKQIGQPLHCAGLVSSRVFDFIDFPKYTIIQNEIHGAHIHSPSGHTLIIGGDRAQAFVIDRSRFDAEIIQSAHKAGADIILESKVVSAERNANKSITVTLAEKDTLRHTTGKILIGADGSRSTIRNLFNFPQPKEMLYGVGAEATQTTLDPHYVEIFIGENIAPGFFAWIIPTNKSGSTARLGLCIAGKHEYSPKQYFSQLFIKQPSTAAFLQNAEITTYAGGAIPLGMLKTITSSNVALVGDAAAQVKPISGGGIYTGLLCARHCSSIVVNALQKQDYSSQVLSKYHVLCNRSIGKELSLGMKFRAVFKKLNNPLFDTYIEKFNNDKIRSTLSTYGDIDYPSKLFIPLLKNAPFLLKFLPHFLSTKIQS